MLLAAYEAEVDVVQIRERDLEAGELVLFAKRMTDAARRHGGRTRVVINDRWDIARAAGADGVHLRADGMRPDRVRAAVSSDIDGLPGAFGQRSTASASHPWIIGRSVHLHDPHADLAGHDPSDYVLFGTVFSTVSKPSHVRPVGLDGVRTAVTRYLPPVIAIGGIGIETAESVVRAGASGVAGIGLFVDGWRAGGTARLRRVVDDLRAAMRSGAAGPDSTRAGERLV